MYYSYYPVNKYYNASYTYNNSFAHYGILGMKWGVRRYQNPDGSYTDAGKKRYAKFMKTLGIEKQANGKYGLSEKQKTTIKTAAGIGLGVLVTAFAATNIASVMKAAKSYTEVKQQERAKSFVNDVIDTVNKNIKDNKTREGVPVITRFTAKNMAEEMNRRALSDEQKKAIWNWMLQNDLLSDAQMGRKGYNGMARVKDMIT